MKKFLSLSLTISLNLVLLASTEAFGLKTDKNDYYLELSAGSKLITPSSDLDSEINANIGKVGVFVHFRESFGLGITGSILEFDNKDGTIGSSTARGTEFGIESRALTPALNFWDTNLRGFVSLGGIINSSNHRRTLTEAGDESLTLTGKSESVEIIENFKSLGPTGAIGVKWDLAESMGFQAEYGIGREKWISESAEYAGEETEFNKVQEGMRTTQFVLGFSLIN